MAGAVREAGHHALGVSTTAVNERQRIETWRLTTAERLGFDVEQAWFVATHDEIDLHELSKLLGRGCPHDLALRILRSW